MNCRIAACLVDDFIDNSLAADQKEAVSQHIESCSACRNEVDARLFLKQRLAELPCPVRTNSYWDNQAELILARTVEQRVSIVHPDRRPHTSDDVRRSFYRSLLAAAASIAILVGSLTLGMSSRYAPGAVLDGENRAMITPALASQLKEDLVDRIIARELVTIGRASALLGPPGSVSTILSISDFVAPK